VADEKKIYLTRGV